MPRFRLRARAQPGEVSVAIRGRGTTATVMPPVGGLDLPETRDLRLSSALHLASALAERLGTNVCILDESETVFFIEDVEEMPLVSPAE